MTKTLAAVVAMPDRRWQAALDSLYPQVDQLAVYLNRFDDVPDLSRWPGIWYHVDPWNNRAAEGLFFWADKWDGYYVPGGDDLIYPPDYVSRLTNVVRQYDDSVVATVHGKIYRGEKPRARLPDYMGAILCPVADDYWINYPGTGGMAFHTKLGVPPEWPMRNTADAQISLWLQQRQIPVRMLAHDKGWVRYNIPDGAHTIWAEDRSIGLARRQSVLDRHSPWQVYVPRGESQYASCESGYRPERRGQDSCPAVPSAPIFRRDPRTCGPLGSRYPNHCTAPPRVV